MNAFGETLKAWRRRRRMSQMALGFAADVSARHVSYLETGKAAPSQPMALRLAEALSVPIHARNEWLTSAGFAPIYQRRALDSDELAPFMTAVRRLLDRHDPYPGWALDSDWRIVTSNSAGAAILRRLGVGRDDSLTAAIAKDPTLGGALVNRAEAVAHLSRRLRAEAGKRNDAATLAMANALDALNTDESCEPSSTAATPTVLEIDGRRIELTSIQAVFNTAEDLTLADLRTELFFPVDEESERNLALVIQA